MTAGKDIEAVDPRSPDELVQEWDALASHREQLIASGRDISYRHVLLPSLRELIMKYLEPGARVLDVGCGTGTFLTELAAEHPKVQFVGIDPSSKSIEIASRRREAVDNCKFHAVSIEDFSAGRRDSTGTAFDVIIANMLLQNVASLHTALSACVHAMTESAVLVFAIPHPCFWPRYWRYEEKPWFSYTDETWIKAPFRTSQFNGRKRRTSHTHRPIKAYIHSFTQVGLLLEDLQEPMPDPGVADAYPAAWEFPRFMLGRCVRDPRAA